MKLAICTLVLNEMEWLEKLYEQHNKFPNLIKWIFVESADTVYAETNPTLVSKEGLSVDGTTEYLTELAKQDSRVTHIKHGICKNRDAAQGKCEARNKYLECIDNQQEKPDFILVLDADEFWPISSQERLEEWLTSDSRKYAFSFKHREIWHTPYHKQNNIPLFTQEVVGGFWDIIYFRAWKYFRGMRYHTNHNTPESRSIGLLTNYPKDHRKYKFIEGTKFKDSNKVVSVPEFIHMGFAAQHKIRKAKNEYYKARGEGRTDKRGWYVDSRAAWETWTPNIVLPKGALVKHYTGQIPECFL